MYEVVRVSSILRSRPVKLSATLNKPATRNTRDASDFVHAKKLARKKTSAGRVTAYSNELNDRLALVFKSAKKLVVLYMFLLSLVYLFF